MINIGTLELADAYVGSTPIEKAYLGSQLVWEKVSDPGIPIVFADSRLKELLVGLWGGENGGTAAASTRLNGVFVPGIAGEITDKQAASIISLPNTVQTLATKQFVDMTYSFSTSTPVYGFMMDIGVTPSVSGQSRFLNGSKRAYMHLGNNTYSENTAWRSVANYWHLLSGTTYITLIDDNYLKNNGVATYNFSAHTSYKASNYPTGKLKVLVDVT